MNTEHAWAAGLFDGEGCTSISRHKQYRQIQMFVSQSGNPLILQRFQAAVGVGRVRGPYKGSNPRAKLKYTWHVSKMSDALHVAQLLWPYLSPIKKAQFLHATEEIHMAKQDYSFPGKRADQPGGGMTPQVADEKAPDSLRRPDIPQLEPAIRGIAENAGFDATTLEGEALLAPVIGGVPNYAALRDGDNSKSLGDNPDYPQDLMGDAFKGVDQRPGR